MIDHLVYATRDLDAALDDLERKLGVRAAPGGKHTGGGTHNALLSFGDGAYLEIIGPDPEQEPPKDRPMAFGIDKLTAPRLVTWAAKAPTIAARVARAREEGYDPGTPTGMSRLRPDGVRLAWILTRAPEPAGDGLVPFLIDWGDTPHPSDSAPGGSRLIALRAEHPQPEVVRKALAALGEDLEVQDGPVPALIAIIEGPNGRLELR